MTESVDPHKAAALKKLAEHLAAFQDQVDMPFAVESDMLSLIVSGTLHGENLAERYPAFYRKLLENSALREAFLEALESVEAESTGALIPLPANTKTTLDFLKPQTPASIVEHVEQNHWRAVWQRSLEQLQTILSPPKLAYRADPLMEDPWFTLLREAITAGSTSYEFSLECTLTTEQEIMLATSINLAVTLRGSATQPSFPVRAHLQWGAYDEAILLHEEGRMKFPDIPLEAVFDSAANQISAELNFTLESAA